VRSNGRVRLTKTKSQQQTIHPDVQRTLTAFSVWRERINTAIAGARGAPLSELLDYARVRPMVTADA